jgi:hypothetical protein
VENIYLRRGSDRYEQQVFRKLGLSDLTLVIQTDADFRKDFVCGGKYGTRN